jgi:hypothetical protein
MCAGCGLPTTHTMTFGQWLGVVSLTSFSLLSFMAAWWIIGSSYCKRLIRQKLDHYFPTPSNPPSQTI